MQSADPNPDLVAAPAAAPVTWDVHGHVQYHVQHVHVHVHVELYVRRLCVLVLHTLTVVYADVHFVRTCTAAALACTKCATGLQLVCLWVDDAEAKVLPGQGLGELSVKPVREPSVKPSKNSLMVGNHQLDTPRAYCGGETALATLYRIF